MSATTPIDDNSDNENDTPRKKSNRNSSKIGKIVTQTSQLGDRKKHLLKHTFQSIHAFFNKEPGTIVCLDEEWPLYKNFEDYETLVMQIAEENDIEKKYSVTCNALIKKNSIKLDKNNKIISMIPGCPLCHLLLQDDTIIDYNGVTVTNKDNEEKWIPDENVKKMKLTISRLGRVYAVPAMRARKHNLTMDLDNYYYYVVEVPRIVGMRLGFDMVFNSREKDFVITNTSLNSIGGVIFEQGDHVVDINGIMLSCPNDFQQILKDPKTYPSFTALVKKPSSKSSIMSTKNFLNSLNSVYITPDMKEVVSKIEDQVKEFEKYKMMGRSILKKRIVQDSNDIKQESNDISESTNNNDCKLSFSPSEPEVINIESSTQNPLYLENVTGSVKFL
uniref:PDZ domain-containing protein n=2 Tax=Strongyloides papillosus TaxID=174720 RepID=A0A0N5C7J0_STREA